MLAEISSVDFGSNRQGKRTSPSKDDGKEEGDSNVEEGYNGSLDDGATLLADYIQGLNPGVKVNVVLWSNLLRSLENTTTRHPPMMRGKALCCWEPIRLWCASTNQ